MKMVTFHFWHSGASVQMLILFTCACENDELPMYRGVGFSLSHCVNLSVMPCIAQMPS